MKKNSSLVLFSTAVNAIAMKPVGTHNYFVYITTNQNKTVLYNGVTNDLYTRLIQHQQNAAPYTHKSFAGRYNAHFLLYYERFG